MTENESIKILKGVYSLLIQSHASFENVHDYKEASEEAIKALKEVQQYRALGTVGEIQELKERDTAKLLLVEQNGNILRYCCPCCGAFFYQHAEGKMPVYIRKDHHCTCGQRIMYETDD